MNPNANYGGRIEMNNSLEMGGVGINANLGNGGLEMSTGVNYGGGGMDFNMNVNSDSPNRSTIGNFSGASMSLKPFGINSKVTF